MANTKYLIMSGLLSSLLMAPPIYAEDDAATHLEGVSDREVIERIAYLQAGFDDAELSGRLWIYGWLAVFGGLTLYNVLGIANESREWDVDLTYYTVGAVKAGLAFSLVLISPFYPAFAGRTLESMPGHTAEKRRDKLALGEELLAKCKKKVLGDRTFFKHALKIGINLVGGAIIWGVEGRDGWKHALLSTGVGIGLAVGSIWTMSTKTVSLHEAYHEKYRGPETASAPYFPRPRFYWAPYPEGVVAGVIF